MENVKNVSSEEELLQLRNDGRITRAEYEELLSEIRKTPGKPSKSEMVLLPPKRRGLGIASFVLSIAGIFLPLFCIIIVLALGINLMIGIWFILADAVELVAFVFGIISRRTAFGKAGFIISGITIILTVLFVMQLMPGMPVIH